MLWGRCSGCAMPIALRYPLVELLTAGLYLAAWWRFGLPVAPIFWIFLSLLIAATFIDFDHLIIPDEITLGGIVVGFLLSVAVPDLQGVASIPESIKASGIGVVVGGGVVYAVLRLGKLLFGRERVPVSPETPVIFHEAGLVLPTGEIPYEEVFYRESDAVTAKARRVELFDRCFSNVPVRLELMRKVPVLRIGEETFEAADQPWMSVET